MNDATIQHKTTPYIVEGAAFDDHGNRIPVAWPDVESEDSATDLLDDLIAARTRNEKLALIDKALIRAGFRRAGEGVRQILFSLAGFLRAIAPLLRIHHP